MNRSVRGRADAVRVGLEAACLFVFALIAAPSLAAISATGDVQPAYPATNPDPWNVGDEIRVGDSASGTLLISAGSDVISSGGSAGFDPLINGTITVTGGGSTWTNSQNVALGIFGTGRIEVLDGAQVENRDALVGHITGDGQVLVSGAGSQWNNLQNLFVGNSGSGSLTIQQQGVVRSSSAVVAVSNTSSGTVLVDGAQSTWEVTNSLSVSGSASGGIASLTLAGAGSRVYVGAAAIAQGASLPIDHTAIIVSSLAAPAQLSVYKGNSIVNAGSAYIGAGVGEAGVVVVDGAASTWTNGGGVYVGLNGSGILTLVGGATVSSSGPVAVGAAGTVSGAGTVVGSLSNSGLVEPGHEVGTLMVDGSYSQAASGSLRLDLAGAAAGTFDTLEVSNQATLDGALEVELGLDGGSPFVPQRGNSFEILTAAGGLTGVFASADLPMLSAGKMWHVRYDAHAVSLVVKLAGDYNGDGVVDAADYTVWRDRFGNTLDPIADGDTNGVVDIDDYHVWKAGFGATAGLGAGAGASVASAAVPEPTTLLLATALLSLLAIRCCSRGR